MSMSAPSARIVNALTGAKAPTEFFKALDDATRQAAESALTRGVFAAAVGDYSCPCGSTYEFADDSTLEEYAGLNRWLGRHGLCTDSADAAEVERLRDENDELRIRNQELWQQVCDQATGLARVSAERDTWRAAVS